VTTVLAKRIAWRRRNVPHHYIGALLSFGAGIRLVGREPATGIELALSIPFEEIEDVRASAAPDDELVGGQSVVLDLAEADAVLLREIGGGPLGTAELAARLERLRAPWARRARTLGVAKT